MAGYLGDKKSKLVPHLTCKQNECDIYNIEKRDRQYFTPDSLENAKSIGFNPCRWCN